MKQAFESHDISNAKAHDLRRNRDSEDISQIADLAAHGIRLMTVNYDDGGGGQYPPINYPMVVLDSHLENEAMAYLKQNFLGAVSNSYVLPV